MKNRLKKIFSLLLSLIILGLIISFFLMDDKNYLIVEFMKLNGLHPDPKSEDFTIADGVFRFGANIFVICSIPILFLSSLKLFFFSVSKNKEEIKN